MCSATKGTTWGFNILALFISGQMGCAGRSCKWGWIAPSSSPLSSWSPLAAGAVVAAIICNLVLTLNHKPGRYQIA